eukprot:4667403-Lingulodinium_polyedra.AAC.1
MPRATRLNEDRASKSAWARARGVEILAVSFVQEYSRLRTRDKNFLGLRIKIWNKRTHPPLPHRSGSEG